VCIARGQGDEADFDVQAALALIENG